MTLVDALREGSMQSGRYGSLSLEMLRIVEQYQAGLMSSEEMEFLVREITEVRAAQELADDEENCRMLVAVGRTILAAV